MSCEDEIEWCTLTWKIGNFIFITTGNTVCARFLKSPIWYSKNTDGEKKWWRMEICHSIRDKFLHFVVLEVQPHCSSHSYQFEVFLISSCRNVPLLQCINMQEFTMESSAIFEDMAQEILPQDTLTVCCKIGLKTMKAGDFHINSVLQSKNFSFKVDRDDSIKKGTYTILEKDGVLFRVFVERKNSAERVVNIFIIEIHGLPNTCGLPCLVIENLVLEKSPIGILLDYGNHTVIPVSGIDVNYPGMRWLIDIPPFNDKPQFQLESVYVLHTNCPNQFPPSSSKTTNEHQKAVPESSSTLSADLLQLYRDQTLSDVTLNTEGKSFLAHRSILAARSGVFRTMFEKKRTKGRLGIVDIKDLDSVTVQHMLIFMYGDSMEDVLWEEAFKLFYAAVKYAIPSLKQKCVGILKASLSVSNACDALVLADTHSDQELQKGVVDFIRDHNEVVSSELWDKLEDSNPRLTSRVTRELFLKKGK